MEMKKDKKYELESKRPLFFGIGLILSLAFVISAFEWRTHVEPVVGFEIEEDNWIYSEIMPYTKQKEPEPPKPKLKKKPIQTIEAKEELEKATKEVEIEIDLEAENEPIIDYGGDNVEVVKEPFLKVEKMPEFPGGEKALLVFLTKNIKYPSEAKRVGAEGYVTVHFIIEKDGSVNNAKVLKGVGFGCDKEAVRVINLLKFSPGKQRGIPVRVQMTVPINFRLQ